MSANAVNAVSGAAKYLRPTLMFTIISASFMIIISLSINKIPKNERKGAGFGLIVIGLMSTILSMMYNFWIYARETGIANAAKRQGQSLYASMQTKLVPPGATQVI
jgi:hypothetical protein